MNNVSTNIRHFFDGVYIYLGLLLTTIGVIFLLFDLIVAALLFATALLVFSTTYRLKIDSNHNTYGIYLSLFGISIGRKHQFQTIDKLILSKTYTHKHVKLKGLGTDVTFENYRAYIVFDKEHKVSLGESKNRSKMEKKVAFLRDKLELPVEDISE